jgi:hypothetical protein
MTDMEWEYFFGKLKTAYDLLLGFEKPEEHFIAHPSEKMIEGTASQLSSGLTPSSMDTKLPATGNDMEEEDTDQGHSHLLCRHSPTKTA